jgi:hypothetical protein
VSFGVCKLKKGTVVLKLPRGSQAYQITKIAHSLELVTVSRNNPAAFRRADLVANLQVVPPVAWDQEGQLLEQIEWSTLHDAPKGGDHELAHFGFINRKYFRSAETEKSPHTYIRLSTLAQ